MTSTLTHCEIPYFQIFRISELVVYSKMDKVETSYDGVFYNSNYYSSPIAIANIFIYISR